MPLAHVTTNHRVTIPKNVRELQNIHIGDNVLFEIIENKIHFKRIIMRKKCY